MKLAFAYAPNAFGPRAPIDFEDVESCGLTGTDLIALYYAKEMVARGHEATLYMPRTAIAAPSDRWEGVRLADFALFAREAPDYDVAIATSSPNVLHGLPDHVLRCVNRQVGPFGIDCTPGFDDYVDRYFCPSLVAIEHVAASLPEKSRAKFRHLPNGCYPEHFDGREKTPGLCLYTSSPDRGLHLALMAWPHVVREVPHAKLRIFYYALDRWLAFATRDGAPDTEETRRAFYIKRALERFGERGGMGIERIGGVSHRRIEHEISAACALVFPTDCLAFTETFSVASLEACAGGAVPLLSSADSLEGIYGDVLGDVMTKHPVRKRMPEYIGKVIRALTDDAWRKAIAERTRFFAEAHAWPKLAMALEGFLEEAIFQKKANGNGTRVSVRDLTPARPEVHLVLTAYASGDIPIDLDDPKADAQGGGCRAGFMGLVRALAAPELGWKVSAFSTFKDVLGKREKDGITYYAIDQYRRTPPPAAVLAYYDTSPIVDVPATVLRIASHHTFRPPADSFEWADVNLAPSQYTVVALRTCFGGDAWHVLPNGVGDVPEWTPVRGRVLYHTAASRGLHLLVEMWPQIRAAVPGATLHIVGNAREWAAGLRGQSSRQAQNAARFEIALRRAEAAGGVELLGFLPRAALEKELAEASCFAFPAAPVGPCETFSISIMECCKIGIPVVLAPVDALESIYGRHVVIDRLDTFADTVAKLLLLPNEERDWISLREKSLAKRFTFQWEAQILDGILREQLRLPQRCEAKDLAQAIALDAAGINWDGKPMTADTLLSTSLFEEGFKAHPGPRVDT